jgi:hypothetical protein
MLYAVLFATYRLVVIIMSDDWLSDD